MRYGKQRFLLLGWTCVSICLVTRLAFSAGNEFRNWTTSNGRKSVLKMAVVDQTASTVRLKRQDNGEIVEIPITRLSRQDQQYLRELAGPDAEENPFAEPSQPGPSIASSSDAGGNPSNSVRGVRWTAPSLTDENLDEWITFLRPKKEELKWREIRWHNNLADAADEARRLKRPILLWTMNGNPCGET